MGRGKIGIDRLKIAASHSGELPPGAGCDLVGGRIEPVGVLFAAVTLSLLGTLLGFMRLSSDIIAAVQGFILIGIVVSRTIWTKRR